MSSIFNSSFLDKPLYKKALEISMLSQNISTYLCHDLSALSCEGTEDADIYFSGDIVQQSINLIPEIISAETEVLTCKRERHIERLNRLTFGLYKNCKRLEKAKSNGRDFIPILRNELRIFKKLQNSWLLTL